MSEAIEAGIFNDLGSGSNVDICVIEKGRTDYLRNHVKPNERGVKEQSYKFPKGTTGEFVDRIWERINIQLTDFLFDSNLEGIHKKLCGRCRRRCNGYVLNKVLFLVTINSIHLLTREIYDKVLREIWCCCEHQNCDGWILRKLLYYIVCIAVFCVGFCWLKLLPKAGFDVGKGILWKGLNA